VFGVLNCHPVNGPQILATPNFGGQNVFRPTTTFGTTFILVDVACQKYYNSGPGLLFN
jgi:hypothetical protein